MAFGSNKSESRTTKSKGDSIIYFKPIDSNYLEYLNANNVSPEELNINDFYRQNNNYVATFFSYQTKEEIYFDIFSSFVRHETFRRVFLYNNPEIVQEYFLTKYNKCFFPKDYKSRKWDFSQVQLFSNSGSITFEDFKEVILPNFKFSFFEEIDSEELQPIKNNFSVVFSWDFFNDKAYLHTENTIYRSDYLHREKINIDLESYTDAILYSLDFLFEYPFSTVDTRLNGLCFERAPLNNKTILKLFEYSRKRKCLIPYQRGFENIYKQKIGSESNLKTDFEELQQFFQSKLPFVRIIKK